jgi:hypothetical protein
LDYKTITPIDGYTAQDGFCDETGAVNPGMPGSLWGVKFAGANQRTLVTTVVQYASSEALQAAIDMGMQDGMASTMERLDAAGTAGGLTISLYPSSYWHYWLPV